ncbi:uncharacterized protein LOC126612529 isoform X1 [Malus sylvestris]|uniref:uncharacterized protein isoform X1 n=1 Tax=Malus domestica TaxID=3750 RepID=UPI0010AB2D99|nr:uncharacterized protein LOC103418115 isoform X3 [Malus domestica]XP_050136926.1 uncharacterized protein LOC126612529 isoform X1 [Malus sylvestris]
MFGLQHILKRVVDHPICLLQRLLKKIKQYGNGSSSGFRGDVLSKVFGAERHGRARGVGGGVPPTKLGIFSQQKLRNHQMDEKVHNLTNQVRALTELVYLFMKNQGNDLPSEASPDTQVAAPEAHVDTVARTETCLSHCATNESWWRGYF